MEEQSQKYKEQKKNDAFLIVACSRGYIKDVEALLERGASLNSKDKNGLQPLHHAAAHGCLDIVKLLWAKGADMDSDAPNGSTPLHFAAQGGHADTIAFLTQKGVWIDSHDSQDNRALHLAARNGHCSAVEALLRAGSMGLDIKNKMGMTPAAESLIAGHIEAFETMLKWNATIDVSDSMPGGYSLLHIVAGLGKAESLERLLQFNTIDSNQMCRGTSPLHSAVIGGDPTCVRLLLRAGADMFALDANGQTVLDVLPSDKSNTVKGEKIRTLLQDVAASTEKTSSVQQVMKGDFQEEEKTFKDLPVDQKISKIKRWSNLPQDSVKEVLPNFPEEVQEAVHERLLAVKQLQCAINIHKAMSALHDDDDFQSDASKAYVAEAIDALRSRPDRYEEFSSDPTIVAVLAKLRLAHAVVQANGQRTLSLDDVLVQKTGWQRQDEERLKDLEKKQDSIVMSIAILGGEPSDESLESKEMKERNDDANVPEWLRGGFSWGKVWKEFLQQSLRSGLTIAVLLIFMRLLLGHFPWQSSSHDNSDTLKIEL